MTAFKGTPGPWYPPHLSCPDCACNCSFVLVEGFMGSVATINYSNEGDDWRLGDYPLLEQAKYNGLLISKAPELLYQLERIVQLHKAGESIPLQEIEAIIKSSTEI